MVRLDIRCPRCSRRGTITINKEDIELKPSGLFSVNIDKNFTCEHSYIVYIDYNFNIRDYFELDYNVELPEVQREKETDFIAKDSVESVEYDFGLIKLNLTPNILTVIFKAIISKKPCIFIEDKNILYDYLIPFYKTINEEAFEFEIELISEEIYNNSKSKFKNYLVVNSTTIINNPHKFIDTKKLNIEKRIINAFMVETNIKTALKVIKRHAKIAFDLAGIVCDYVNNHMKEKHIYSKTILDYLEDAHNITISTNYLDFLIEIVNHYFEIPVKLSLTHYTGLF
ncbi:MAG: hypothetical protein ACFFDF_10790 [Candidatus Odinarchaeota archaeon]